MTATRTPPARRRAAAPPPRRGPSPSLPVLAVLGVAALALVAFLFGGGEDAADPALQQTAEVTVEGEALPPFTGAEGDPAVGMPAPELLGSTFDGAPVDLSPGEHPTVLLFATHWCGYCQNEVRALSPWLAEGGAGSAKVLVVSTGVDAGQPNYPPSSWFERESWPGAVMADSPQSTAAEAFGLTGYPYFVFLDGDGRVVARHSGELGAEQLQAITDDLQAR